MSVLRVDESYIKVYYCAEFDEVHIFLPIYFSSVFNALVLVFFLNSFLIMFSCFVVLVYIT